MADFRNNTKRLTTKFHQSLVSHVLPEIFAQDYPQLIKFLEKYYEYTDEEMSGSFEEQIRNLFDIRDISSTSLEHLDYILDEISDGLDHTEFAANPRLMTKLISAFYRAKGSQISVEQFFKSFYNEDIELVYPKRNIFILNDSWIGPQYLKFIQDDKRYQIFSVVIRTGLSFSDYEALYKKFVHPAGWYLSADVVTQSNASVGVTTGETTDPLEVPNYPIVMGNSVDVETNSEFVLLTMRETDVTDADIIISSEPLLSTYETQTFQSLQDEGYTTFGDLVDLNSTTTIDGSTSISSETQTIDQDQYT
jgi:hypothetical protein